MATVVLASIALAALEASPLLASDHADPMIFPPKQQEAGLTGFFAFPRDDRLILILNIRRALTTPKPYPLDAYEYAIHMDLASRVRYDKAEDVARYGGTVDDPAGIASQIDIRFRLTNDVELQPGYPRFEGPTSLPGAADFPVFVGVRDDPFIFPRFAKKNVISMAVSIPFSAFPPDQQDWLLWATTTKASDGKLIDHVGRANRTQLGRLDSLNTLPPNEHARALHARYDRDLKLQRAIMHAASHVRPFVPALNGLFQYVLQIRYYDIFPDVMIFTNRRPAGFPNGRRLEDDVAGLTCAQGDCILQEIAFSEGGWPRATVNDVPLSDDFPYLGAPHPELPAAEDPDHCLQIFLLTLLALALLMIFIARRRAARNEAPTVRR